MGGAARLVLESDTVAHRRPMMEGGEWIDRAGWLKVHL